MAWIVPASTIIASPAATGSMLRLSSSVPVSIPSLTLSSVTPGLSPAATCAPGSAASAYQHSLFPRGSPYFCAILSSGCTCTLSFSLAKITLISSGDSGDGAPAPSRASEASRNRPPSVCPACGPVSTTHSSPVSHTSPIGFLSATRSYQGRRSQVPHTRSTNRGAMRNGASS